MPDGHYLSTYLTEPGMPFLNNSWTRHDNNISLWRKSGSQVSLLHYWELERFSGIKHHAFGVADREQATRMLDSLLGDAAVRMSDIVEVWGTPDVGEQYSNAAEWYADVALPYHSICHLFSAALLDGQPSQDRMVLGFAVDGGPDTVIDDPDDVHWYVGGVFGRGSAEFFPVESPGPLYNMAARRYNLEEGTLMALAGASPAHVELPELQAEVLSGVRFYGRTAFSDSAEIVELIESTVQRRLRVADLPPLDGLEDRGHVLSAVMKHVQAISTAVMERNVEETLARCDLDPRETDLAMAGGYALNCPTNSHLMRRYGFRRLLAPPCANDSGQSLGIGLATFHARLENFEFRFPGAYLGSQQHSLEGALDRYGDYVTDTRPIDLDEAVRDIRRGPIPWVNGRAELGPRALGNRSLFCDPTRTVAKNQVNRLKGRQNWRPVAPVVMADRVTECFDDARASPYMLETFVATSETATRAPAIVHLDGSARVQTVDEQQNPLLYQLLARFDAVTGVPILGNTSLNDKGEPIVQDVGDAINFCLRKGLSVAYLAGFRVEFANGNSFPETVPALRRFSDFSASAEKLAELTAKYNPFSLDGYHLLVWLRVPEVRHGLDLHDSTHLPTARRRVDDWLARYPSDREWYLAAPDDLARYLKDLQARGFQFGQTDPAE
ncbi:carbamoyltransferase C-terminal domain-containing protein [Actinocatenispora thailandica]|nr:carbamoyltransferase C-terminal domain-containing protein [Actinocatenispora thailandica]